MLVIKCKKNGDGTYNAGVFQNERPVDPLNFTLKNATCEEIRKLHEKVVKSFPADYTVTIKGECAECF